MFSAYLKGMSLKIKVALAVSALFVSFVGTASYFTLAYFERTFKKTISNQQFSHVSSLASSIDDKLRIAQNALIAVAATAPRDAFSNAESAQRFLDNNAGLLSIFDNGLFFINTEGIMIVESPYRINRRGRNVFFREWAQKTITSQKPCISDPFISTHSPGQPAIVMTVPIFDKQGKMTGMLTGGLDLLGGNFLAELSRTKIGKTGYLYIIAMNRILIVHPDKSRIMKPAAPPGVNPLVDRAFNGFEGSDETMTSYGIPMLTSIKHLRMTSWILGANYPTAEAYAPLDRAKHYFGTATIITTAVLLLLIWLMMRQLMSPLLRITRHVEHMPQKTGQERLIAIDSQDETGILAAAFNTMINTLNRQQESLKEQVAQAIDELRQKDQILIQQSRQAAMGEMINNIAHQWRQPLNNLGLIIQGIEQSFKAGNLSEEKIRTEVRMAMDTILFMSRTIDDFRNFFRKDKQIQPFTLNETVSRTIDFLSASLRHLNITMTLEAKDTVSAIGYPNEYSQVMLNILNNAKDVLMERQVSAPCIRIRVFHDDGYAVVTVWDNGGGIDDHVLPKIFDPYFSTKEQGKGTGIGLYMSKVIIDQNMKGNIAAYNIDGGAEFRIKIKGIKTESVQTVQP